MFFYIPGFSGFIGENPHTYILGQRHGQAETYFVSLDDASRVMNSVNQTCSEYDTAPQAPTD